MSILFSDSLRRFLSPILFADDELRATGSA